jgi:hypothetical protein
VILNFEIISGISKIESRFGIDKFDEELTASLSQV